VQQKLILTEDGSHSIEVPELGITYHSIHGAIQESKHVFIEAGLYTVADVLPTLDTIRIFEVGFGTGLNALLTIIQEEKLNRKIYYEAIELFPLHLDEARALNYCRILHRNDLQTSFEQLHICDWKREITITSKFRFKKTETNLLNFRTSETCLSGRQAFDLIYFDAFAPNAQPELWTEKIFKKMFSILQPGGVLVTYCSKGSVQRAMQSAGFTVEKISGPPGKREMVRARKGTID
jgi:tRNA U34 5-methylaminomethyl-2-thiouridine-forming methyltransferase MnmC